ncbi:tomoregulin-2-like [Saccostrea echinata]|uniref:tomoregulin-2-like n=1 Tax=Saccostrea echinata TaxID=191078 RepID=UPI002A83A53A|nr:tomoregulin-2-like [Saccostrea echinata]
MRLAAIVFVGLFAVSCGQYDTYYCRYLTNANCVSRPEDLQCGTDGNTYYNDCDLSKAHCKNNAIHRRYKGPCPNDASTTTKPVGGGTTQMPVTNGPTQKPVNGSEIAFDIFCLDLFHHDCSNEMTEALCASNGKTYQNLCEYEKTKCTHRDLHIVKNAPCN